MRTRYRLCLVAVVCCCLSACQQSGYDPLAAAQAASKQRIHNVDAGVPPMCYTKTGHDSNPCWVCHTTRNGNNLTDDWKLQGNYNFSLQGLTNHWTNLFKDPRQAIAAQSDQSILHWVRQNNYTPLLKAMAKVKNFPGWAPDLHYAQGFDAQGFARDGSGWRALRYKPFPGAFWPTNGSTDDVMIRLPGKFRETADGEQSHAIYRINLAITQAAVSVPDTQSDAQLHRRVEPIDETLAHMDLNGDGKIGGTIHAINGLPAHYVGAAANVKTRRWQYPAGTEFLHTVHYLDPGAPGMAAKRLKEVRYSRKNVALTHTSIRVHYADDARETEAGGRSRYTGTAFTGQSNDFGWTFQGYIEDARGRLRLQTREEQLYCMGCHTGIGVTVDGTFAMPRQLPGAAGWGLQKVAGQRDVPQAGSTTPEYQLYLQRAHAGDTFRSNQEMQQRFFQHGQLDLDAVHQPQSGDVGIYGLIAPSKQRALALDKAYRVIVKNQNYRLGRKPHLAPLENVHRKIDNTPTALKASGTIYKDSRLWLNWSAVHTNTPGSNASTTDNDGRQPAPTGS